MTNLYSYIKGWHCRRLIVSLIFTLACFVALIFLRGRSTFDGGYLLALASRIAVLSIITMGGVFVFTVGAFGISLGASTLLGVSVGALVYMRTQSVLLCALVCIATPVITCIVSSLLSMVFKLPAYVTAALMLSLLAASARLILDSNGGEIYTGLDRSSIFNQHSSRFICFIAYTAFCVIAYVISPVGARQKALGDNKEQARLLGISLKLYSAIGFLIAGLGVGIGAYLILCSYPSVNAGSVNDLGFNIIFAILLGGMTLDGGSQSALGAAIAGSSSAILLSEIIFHILPQGESYAAYSQIIRALILLIFMAVWRYIGKNTQDEIRKECP